MKKRIILAAVVLVAVVVGVTVWQRADEGIADDQLTLYGNIDVRLANLSFEVSGRIASLEVEEGATVAAGQPLATLDSRRLVLAREAARGQLGAQQAKLAELEAGTRPEEIAKLRAELDAARVEASNAERNAVRARDLANKSLASSQDADDARAAADAAHARTHATEEALKLAEAGARKEDIAAARANVAALEAELALAQRNLDDADLRAPAAGVIQSRILEPGDMASPDRPVFTLAMTDPLWARVYVGESDLGKVKPGMAAVAHTDSYPGKSYRGWVGYISPSAEFTPKSVETTEIRADLVYQARVYLCNPDKELRQGMPVTVSLDLTAPPLAQPGCNGGASGAGE